MTFDKKPLADEAFCDRLGEGASGADDAETAQVRDALRSYRRESLLWAERRSAAQSSLAAAARAGRVRSSAGRWAVAALALTTVAAGLLQMTGDGNGRSSAADAAHRTMEAAHASDREQIAEDNVLLHSIDAAVNSGSGLPVDALGLQAPPAIASPDGSEE